MRFAKPLTSLHLFFQLAGLLVSSRALALPEYPAPPVIRDHRTLPGAGRLGIGSRVYNTVRNAFATVIAIESRGTFVLRFETGVNQGRSGGGWALEDLAVLEGCSADICVGQEVFNVPRNLSVVVAGLESNGKYVVEFAEGPHRGGVGGNWPREDLAVKYSCSPTGTFCVGSEAYNSERHALVTVVAIQSNGKMVIRFNEGVSTGKAGSGWSENDLAVTAGTYVPGHGGYGNGSGGYGNVGPIVHAGHGGGYPPVGPPELGHRPGIGNASCTTRSNGYSFRVTAPSFGEARMAVIERCDRATGTSFAECRQQAQCQ